MCRASCRAIVLLRRGRVGRYVYNVMFEFRQHGRTTGLQTMDIVFLLSMKSGFFASWSITADYTSSSLLPLEEFTTSTIEVCLLFFTFLATS